MAYDRNTPVVVSPEQEARMRAWAQRKPRVALMGEFSAGKSTLLNFLIEENLIPTRATATEVPPLWFSHGDGAAHWVDENGERRALDLAELGSVPMSARYVRVFSRAEILEHCDIVDTPGISDPNLAIESWRFAAGVANMVLWCSSATQAWRETERSAWLSLPERLRTHSLLIVTRADKLVAEGDRDKVQRRLARETAGLFSSTVFMATPDAVRAKAELADGESSPLWESSGAAALLDRLAERFEAIYAERAKLLSHRLTGVAEPVEPEPVEVEPPTAADDAFIGPRPARPSRVIPGAPRRSERLRPEDAEAMVANFRRDAASAAPAAAASPAGQAQAAPGAAADDIDGGTLRDAPDLAAPEATAGEDAPGETAPVTGIAGAAGPGAGAPPEAAGATRLRDAETAFRPATGAAPETTSGTALGTDGGDGSVASFDAAAASRENAPETPAAKPQDAGDDDFSDAGDAARDTLDEGLADAGDAARDTTDEGLAAAGDAARDTTDEGLAAAGDAARGTTDDGLDVAAAGPGMPSVAGHRAGVEAAAAVAAPYLLGAAHVVAAGGAKPARPAGAPGLWRDIVARTELLPGNEQIAAMIEELLVALEAAGVAPVAFAAEPAAGVPQAGAVALPEARVAPDEAAADAPDAAEDELAPDAPAVAADAEVAGTDDDPDAEAAAGDEAAAEDEAPAEAAARDGDPDPDTVEDAVAPDAAATVAETEVAGTDDDPDAEAAAGDEAAAEDDAPAEFAARDGDPEPDTAEDAVAPDAAATVAETEVAGTDDDPDAEATAGDEAAADEAAGTEGLPEHDAEEYAAGTVGSEEVGEDTAGAGRAAGTEAEAGADPAEAGAAETEAAGEAEEAGEADEAEATPPESASGWRRLA